MTPISPRPVLRVARAQVIKEFMLRKLLAVHRSRSRREHDPRLFCMPDDHIGESIVTAGLYEPDLLEALFEAVLQPWRVTFAESIALDVGANIGNHACFLASRFHTVLAFEPSPLFVHVLSANRLINRAHNIEVFPVGLGNVESRLPFVEATNGNLGSSSYVTDGSASDAAAMLPVRRGDDVLRERQAGRRVSLVKVDVEGFEPEVLDGLSATLRADRPFVLFESAGSGGQRGGTAIQSMLQRLGYDNFYSVERRRPSRGSRLGKLVRSAVSGVDIWIAPVDRLEDRYYSLVLASPAPLETSRLPG